jgi:hypothetical protein
MNTKLNTILAVVIAVGFIGSNAALAQRTEESLEALIPKISGQRSVLRYAPACAPALSVVRWSRLQRCESVAGALKPILHPHLIHSQSAL